MSTSSPPAPAPISMPVRFATGGIGGIIGWIVVHPANTLAVQMTLQASSNAGAAKQSFMAFSKDLIAKRGFASLYDGLSAGCTRQIFYATARLGLFEVFRDIIAGFSTPALPKTGRQEHNIISNGTPVVTFQTRVVAGLASGGIAALIACPAEVCLVRMSNDKTLAPEKRRNYSGVADAGARILKEEGLPAFWRGSGAFVQRAMVVGVCQVGSFDQLKVRIRSRAHGNASITYPDWRPIDSSLLLRLSVCLCLQDLYAAKLGLMKGSVSNVFAAAMTSGLFTAPSLCPWRRQRIAWRSRSPTPLRENCPTGALCRRCEV